MCGGCRVDVGGETQFACVDGPEFDGHQVDFDLLADRLTTLPRHSSRTRLAPGDGAARVAGRPDQDRPAAMPARAPTVAHARRSAWRSSAQRMPEQDAHPRAATSARSTSASPSSSPCSRPSAASSARSRTASTAARWASTSRASSSSSPQGDLPRRRRALLDDNALPGVTGRVCPQETQCEGSLRPRQEGRAGGHRLPGALRRRLGRRNTATGSRATAPSEPASRSPSSAPARPA